MKEQPNYYAVIPAPVRYSEELSANEKLMYGEISALTNKEGYCWATNEYFAELYQVDDRTIRRWLGNLEQAKFITRIPGNQLESIPRKILVLEPWKVKGRRIKMSWGRGTKMSD